MNFEFSEEDRQIQSEIDRLAKAQCNSAQVRKVLDSDAHYDENFWHVLQESGYLGAAIQEEYGGVAAGYLPLCLIAETLGYHMAAVPFSSTLYLFYEAIRLCGSDAEKSSLIPAISQQGLKGTIAFVESIGEQAEEAVQSSVVEGRLNGKKIAVVDGSIADFCVVSARDEHGRLSLFLVDLNDGGVTRNTVKSIDPSRDLANLLFDSVPVTRLGEEGAGREMLEEIRSRAAVLYAFEQLGGAKRALDMAVAYAGERYAFGRPIGSFQSIKHMLADMYVAVVLAEANCMYAAWALSTDDKVLPLAAATARVSATDAFQRCSTDNIQVHGGMGFTWEVDCHVLYRRSNFLALTLGGVLHWEDQLVSHLALGE